MQPLTRIDKIRNSRFSGAASHLPPYLMGLYRLGCLNFEVKDPVPNRFTVRVSGGLFAETFHIRKVGRYLSISDMGETAGQLSPDFLNVLTEETTEDTLLMEDIVREMLVMKRIQMTHAGIFQIVVPVPDEWEYNALLGACMSFDEGISILLRMAREFEAARERQ
ncbi:MAG: hypothetical protein M0P30_13930 [Syntrophorhabdaceae bacterium]|nr:hypothetical protein [Syntrophorhabdaceae bacterium]HOC45179.1 hypothetical protein [Syntrophorhabdaceae bacterium]